MRVRQAIDDCEGLSVKAVSMTRSASFRLAAALTFASAIGACAPAADVPSAAAPVAIDSTRLIRDISVLAHDSMEGRRVGTPGSARARAFLDDAFRARGLQTVPGANGYQHPFTFTRGDSSITGVNVLGMVQGTERAERWIVVTAHYDHLGVRNGEIFNGADDNASGTAALLAIAAGMTKVLNEQVYHKLLCARPIMPLGRDIGYLPGGKDEKLTAWMQPIFDNMAYLLSNRLSGEGGEHKAHASPSSVEQRITQLMEESSAVHLLFNTNNDTQGPDNAALMAKADRGSAA